MRYRGLAKNATRAFVATGLANIYLARQHLMGKVRLHGAQHALRCNIAQQFGVNCIRIGQEMSIDDMRTERSPKSPPCSALPWVDTVVTICALSARWVAKTLTALLRSKQTSVFAVMLSGQSLRRNRRTRMSIPLPKTRGQWAISAAVVAAVLLFLYYGTNVLDGKAVEVSVENGASAPVFAYIDNTGRHGVNTQTINMTVVNGGKTPPGLIIAPGTTRSFGAAVGFGDQPTLHVLEILGDGTSVDASKVADCSFDTVSFSKLKLPPWHVKIKWSGTGCAAIE